MSNLRRVLERQEREEEEIRHRRAEEDRDTDEEKEEMLVATCMLNQSRQHHCRRAPNVDRRRQSQGKRAEALGEIGWEVKVGGLRKVSMWDFVQVVVVATRVLEIRFGNWELRQVSGTSEVCLPSAGKKAWLPWR
ncbi:hypothetical protein L3X38_041837 [Prunus dulcis]|uniref:Uncharacterized protein n=1 Tax=Prunus dulcis TaxID=3755 RepID=A0AAD4UU16_PRUDU|nr:hypothetical protein L3X38_041837 [Prunus dulcis]